MKDLLSKTKKFAVKLLSVLFLFILGCKNNVSNTSNDIRITIAGDEGIIVASQNVIEAKQNTRWKDIKSKANKTITLKDDYDFLEWRLSNKAGDVLTDEKIFTSDAIVFALSKKDMPKASYKVEHWKQNIENDEYKKAEEEAKSGEVGKDTEAIAKEYTGFKAKAVIQAKVKADGSTIIKIEYDRNITSIILDLDGGTTTTHLEIGEGNKKLLKGKFGAEVKIENPTKMGSSFAEWKPNLPDRFPAKDEIKVYIAQWKAGDITITVKGDENVTISSPNTLSVNKGVSWGDIKTQVEKKAIANEYFEIVAWRLTNASGKPLKDETEFKENATVWAVSKRKTAQYIVEHWQQNIDNDEYTKKEEESRSGGIEKDTEAIPKTYNGFKAKAFNQTKIKADGTTIIKIEYNRNITSIVLDLDGGTTVTHVEAGEGNKKLLKGKFGAKVKVENPTKENYVFVGWVPKLPKNFPDEDDVRIYTAQWKVDEAVVYINGDERLDIEEDIRLNVDFSTPKTWQAIKANVLAKVSLKPEWNNEQYGIYEWREIDENGKLIQDSTTITRGMKLFAITNFMRFKMEGTKLLGYEGDRKHDNRPKGKIIIPAETTEISNAYHKAFSQCHRITSVDFSRCVNLTKIEAHCFYNCMNLQTVDFSGCINLTSITGFEGCKSLKNIDLSPCKNLTTIERGAFVSNEALKHVNLSGLTKLTTIGEAAFGGTESLETIDFSDLVNLKSIEKFAFVSCYSLEIMDLSKCNKLTKIGEFAFDENRSRLGAPKLIVKLPKSIEILGMYCFGSCDSSDKDWRCRRVIVPNDEIKQKVIATGYPEERIGVEL